MGFDWKRRFFGRSPLTVVEGMIAFFAIIGGLYLLTPAVAGILATIQPTPVIQVVAHPWAISILALWAIGSGLLDLMGIYRYSYRLRAVGIFGMIMARIYSLIATIIGIGFFPMTWLSNLLLIFVLVVCYFVVRGRLKWRRVNN